LWGGDTGFAVKQRRLSSRGRRPRLHVYGKNISGSKSQEASCLNSRDGRYSSRSRLPGMTNKMMEKSFKQSN